jgi:hypothetical protein
MLEAGIDGMMLLAGSLGWAAYLLVLHAPDCF